MTGATISPASVCTIELEIPIEAPRERVWKAVFEETNLWWMPDFRVAGENSKVTFDPAPGGRGMVEETEDGVGLLWFSVQMHLPADYKIYLFGHIAQDWGGPQTSTLKLELAETETGCILRVSDARFGNIDAKGAETYEAGWKTIFGDGLKAYVEKS